MYQLPAAPGRYRTGRRLQTHTSSSRLDRRRQHPSTSSRTDSAVNSRRILIVGGGIVGLATAFKLGRGLPGAQITILEKEEGVGRHQSSHNSGVLHCGLYYKPGSVKARLAVSGIQEMIAFCSEHNIPHEVCGKLVVAVEESELPRLDALHERGRQNGLQGLKLLKREQMRA